MEIKIKSSMKNFKRLMKNLPDKVAFTSAVTAINRAARDGKREGIKVMVARTGVRRSAIGGMRRKGKTNIKARITGASGNARATKDRLSAMIFVKSDIPVKFSTAYGKGAVKKISSLNRNAFPATMPSGKRSQWARTGEAKRYPTKGSYLGRNIKREPIKELEIPIRHATALTGKAIQRKAAEVLPKEFQRISQRKLAQLARR